MIEKKSNYVIVTLTSGCSMEVEKAMVDSFKAELDDPKAAKMD